MSTTLLEKARTVTRPSREAMLQSDHSVNRFWNDNEKTFEAAWREWESENGHAGIALDSSLYAPALRRAIEEAWKDPTKEPEVKDLWTEVFPNVYKAQFFDPDKLPSLRDYLDKVANANIPLRRPYGIVLNRGGAMLDPRSEGYLAAPTFQTFYQELMDVYMRPVARLLFPDVYGYDSQTFGFSITWQAGKIQTTTAHGRLKRDVKHQPEFAGENFSGSAVRFMDSESRKVESLTFEPGTALIHHGRVPHASEPITEGERHNFVLWLYGEGGQIPYQHGAATEPLSAKERVGLLARKIPTDFPPFNGWMLRRLLIK